jgi:DNA adenine methylase
MGDYDFKTNHFFFSYAGNKRDECERIYDYINSNINLNNIQTVIEPFCGTSAFSFYLSKIHPKKYKYILNDNNKYLIKLYEIARSKQKLKRLVNKLNKMTISLNKNKYDDIAKTDTFESYIITQKIHSIRAGLFPIKIPQHNYENYFNSLLDCDIIDFIRNEDITFTNLDSIDVVEKHMSNKKNIIFLDPPYLTECNDFYYDSKTNIYEYLYNHNIKKMKSNIVLVLSDNWIVRLLFDKQIKAEYDKLYQTSKKTVKHLIISNV